MDNLPLGSLFAVQVHPGSNGLLTYKNLSPLYVCNKMLGCPLSVPKSYDDTKREEEADHQGQLGLPSANPSLHISNLGFSYSNNASQEEQTLSPISMDIDFGQCVAFAGASGCGKSTLLKILAKQYHKNQGSIKVDHTELDKISVQLWRNNVSAMMQDDFIFAESITYNIALGRKPRG